MTTPVAIRIAAFLFVCFYAVVRFRRELGMMQQNSYRTRRYLRWLKGDLGTVARVVDLLLLGVVAGFRFTRWEVYATGAVGLMALYKGVRELRVKYKKSLVMTARARRIMSVGIVLLVAAVAYQVIFYYPWQATLAAMGMAVLSPLWVCVAVWLLAPLERAINEWYIADARRILRSMPRLVVIGITGSYGKTSTKHFLHRILSERFSVVMTPGSFNTTLGVVRTVREHLRPHTEVLIVEMGAKQRGDIAEICRLVKPTIGIITAVGEQHLESFKTVENVCRTKFELIDALPPDGVAILNDDFEPIARREVTNAGRVVRYKSQTAGHADCRVTDVAYGEGETTFRIVGQTFGGQSFTTRLAGIHNLSNVTAACIAGQTLGVTADEMRHAIAQIEPVEHRLEIKTTPGGVRIIDDAFNSNPHGAAMALDVLAGFTAGRRIVVTPGMIELGARGHHHNRELGRRMAASCDLAIVVGEYNREAIIEGFNEGLAGIEKNGSVVDPPTVVTARNFDDASRHVAGVVRTGDTVLYENDLPDTFK